MQAIQAQSVAPLQSSDSKPGKVSSHAALRESEIDGNIHYVPTRLLTIIVFVGAAVVFGCTASGQQDNQVLGTWTLVSVEDVRPDGRKPPLFGPNPEGMLVFDARGRHSLQICDSARLKFAANDRLKSTPEENQAAVRGCNPHWGRYSVSPGNKTVNFKIDHALFKNWEGTEQKRSFTLVGDELTYNVPNPSEGSVNPVLVWKRTK
jgi:hypothetical protein